MTASRNGPLLLLLFWSAGAAAWNVAGVQRVAAGEQPLGPTASITGAIVIGVLALVLIFGSLRPKRLLLATASAVIALAAGLAIWGAITGTPDQWPSPAWRLGGAVLNGVGLVAALLMLFSLPSRT